MTKPKLLLVNPPFPRKVSGVPLQMLYLAAAVKDADAEVQLLDLDIEPNEQREFILEKKLKDYQPTHAGVTAYSPNYPESLDIMRKIKDVNPSITVISGGPHQIVMGGISPKPEFIDHIVTATFGEYPLLELLNLERRTVDRTTLFPAFELLKDNPQYQFDSELFQGKRMTQILTATGCNQTCNFCSAQQEYKPFPSDAVVAQLRKVRDLGYEAVFFNDPNFTNPSRGVIGDSGLTQIQGLAKSQGVSENYNRIIGLMNSLIESGLSNELAWGCQTKASMVNPLVLDWMSNAGCKYITYALETVDDKALKEMHKGLTVSHVNKAIELSRERSIKVGLYVMFGNNPDTERDFELACMTLDHVERLKPDYLSISILANYPMIDRSNPRQRLHMHLDYANKKYSREPIWLKFDEGWGAFHPNTDVKQAERYQKEIERRMAIKPEIWNTIRRF